METQSVAPLISAGAALVGAAIGFIGGIASRILEERYKRKQWIRDKQSDLYERLTKEVIKIGEMRAKDSASTLDLSELKTDLYLFLRMYFASGVPYKERSRFQDYLNGYQEALDKGDPNVIHNTQGELVNYLSEIARRVLQVPDAPFRL